MGIFEDISYGDPALDDELITEAGGFINTIRENVVINKSMYLPKGDPEGKGNIAFLYTHDTDESMRIIKNKTNLVSNNKYKLYYYNMIYKGKIYNKRFNYNLRNERKELYTKISKEAKLTGVRDLGMLGNNVKNLYFDMSKYLDILTSICFKLTPKMYVTEYWKFIKQITGMNINGYDNKFIIVDLKGYKISKKIRENLNNPLFMIYYSLLIRSDLMKDMDVTFYFFNEKKILKITPSNLVRENDLNLLKINMTKMMTGITKKEVVVKATDEKEIEKEEIITTTTTKLTELIDKEETLSTDEQLVKMRMTSPIEKDVSDKVTQNVEKISNKVVDTSNDRIGDKATKEVISDAVTDKVKKEIDADHELLMKMYYSKKRDENQIKSAASTARDKQLREEQKKLEIKGMTFDKLSKINTFDVPIPETDISTSLETTNKNMNTIRFANLDKTYNKDIIKKDIMNAFTSLNNKSIPLFIRKIDVKDSSDELNYKDTYTLSLEDGNRQRHTVKVDIPKFVDDKFLYIGGNKKVIKHQSFFLPVVKVDSNKVEIVTNYSKMTIERMDYGFGVVDRMKKLIKDQPKIQKMFKVGTSNNGDAITTLEYDQYSRMYLKFDNGDTHIIFDQPTALEDAKTKKIKIPEECIYIGTQNGKNLFLNTKTQKTTDDKMVTDVILDSLGDVAKTTLSGIRAGKRLSYTKVKIMKQNMNVGMLLGLWDGLTNLLKRLGIEYELLNNTRNLSLDSDKEVIVFKDCVMVYKQDVVSSLILNGIRAFNTPDYDISAFDEKEPYIDYITKIYGKSIIENALMNFYEFVLDPITIEVLEYLHLPTNIIDLYIHAVNLLADNNFKNSINQNLSRIRCGEIIPAILYERLAKNYVTYRNSDGRKKFSIPQNAVIKEVLSQKTVEDYSTLNPVLEMDMLHAVSTKGFRGVNLDDSYTIEKRAYDNSMIGIIAPNTSPDGSVGISRNLTLEPKIKNIRGIIEDNHESLDKLNDVNLFCPGELSVPMAATIDDPNRLGFSSNGRDVNKLL